MSHPRICFAYLNGVNQRNGCSKGKDCKYYHPKLCWSYNKSGKCSKKDCQFYHHKKKAQQIPARVESKPPPAPRYESEARPQSYAAAVRGDVMESQNMGSTELNRNFLALQEQLQEQMRQTQQLIQVLLLKEGRNENARQISCQCNNRS